MDVKNWKYVFDKTLKKDVWSQQIEKMKEKSSERVRLQIQWTCQTVGDIGRIETSEKY